MDSSIVSQTIDTAVPPSTVIAHVSNHDAHHENGNEPSRTRRRHSLGTSHDHPGLAQPTCEAVRRRRGCACVAPRLRWPLGGAGFDTSGRSVSVCGLCYARDGFGVPRGPKDYGERVILHISNFFTPHFHYLYVGYVGYVGYVIYTSFTQVHTIFTFFGQHISTHLHTFTHISACKCVI